MGKLIAVDGMILIPDDPTVIATITEVSQPSLVLKSGGNGVNLDQFEIQVTNITVPTASATIPDPGPYNVKLTATAETVKSEDELVLREDDESETINATPKIPNTPTPIDYPISFKIKISVAGQTKVGAV